MVNINTSFSGSSSASSATATTGLSLGVSSATKISTAAITSGTSSNLSTLARQLSEAATRAEVRDASLSRKELGEKAKTILDQVVADSYTANKAKHDAEVPNTNDPELLARAKQATTYVNSRTYGSTDKVQSPFAGLSRDQLALIVYDESGSFTVNERHAAYLDLYEQEQVWRRQAIAQADMEYQLTGKQTNFFAEVLKHYESLSPIEQAQYPGDYAARLQGMIDLDFNYMTHQTEGDGASSAGLIEHLLAAGPYAGRD
ncbi:hypothetical protein [Azotobacter vinelandii]|uniref:hypothetical protein n=1 Tax=Azotobacter vinelandii TaxID=354 RepID=UPI00266516C2|nr:hypothetical protein [Azotobacter vinelandii]WKN22502.1 hypothetical protein AVAEIV_000489 [Azotobacter vinelandii]